MMELATSQQAHASSRLAEILIRNSSDSLRGGKPSVTVTGVNVLVVCPKKHTAVLHITKHSSFRCDICKNGVERGRPMHGCRECDWDACEDCTDKAESGIVKFTAIQDLASECLLLLNSRDLSCSQDERVFALMSSIPDSNNIGTLKGLAMRLLERDQVAVRQLSPMLDSSGSVTMHQFLSILLPSIHAALMDSSPACLSSNGYPLRLSPRYKKAKLGGIGRETDEPLSTDSPEERLVFANVNTILQFMVLGQDVVNDPMSIEDCKPESTRDHIVQDEEPKSHSENPYLEVSVTSCELIRRIQKIISLYENLAVWPEQSKKPSSSNSDDSELQSLTKPIELELAASPFDKSDGRDVASISIRLKVEPLVPLHEIELFTLQPAKSPTPLISILLKGM